MRKKVIIIAVTVVIGFLSGYFSEPVAHFFSSLEFPEFKLSKISWFSDDRRNKKDKRSTSDPSSVTPVSVPGAISAEAAVHAVKALPVVKELMASAAARGYQVSFRADQPPSKDYPVWLVELRQVYPNQIPDIIFLKVDSMTGKVLDIQKDELQTAGFKLSSPPPSGSRAARLLQTRYVYNDNLKRKVRLDKYKGFEVESDRQKEVIRLTVAGPGISGPRGLTVGADAGDVVKKFGKANIAQGELLIYNSVDDSHLQLHVKLEKEKVASFSLVKITD